MVKKFLKRFQDDRKYFTIVFFVFILLIISALISPKIIQYQTEIWREKLPDKIAHIEEHTYDEFKQIESRLIAVSQLAKTKLRGALSEDIVYGKLVKIVNHEVFNDYSLEILAPNGKLIAWNLMIAVPQEEIFPLDYPLGETHFFRSSLITYLTITDTIESESDIFYLVCSVPFEKHYILKNNYYKSISFSKIIAEANSVQAEIYFDPFGQKTTDERKYSFDLLNNKNKKIGQVTITKPLLEVTLNNTNLIIEIIQSIFVFTILLFLGLGLSKEYKILPNSYYKLFLLSFYLVIFRYVIYQLGFPANLINGVLSDPSYFSSAFAGGIVRSPIEFLVSSIFFTILCVKTFQYVLEILFSEKFQKITSSKKIILISIIPTSLLFFLGLRGLAAIMRSVIFDSTIRYFRDPLLLPDLTTLAMNLNVLLSSFSITLLLTLILVFQIQVIISTFKKNQSKNYSLSILVYLLIGGFIYSKFQPEPLLNLFLIVLIICLLFFLSLYIYFRLKKSKYVFVYAALVGSVISIFQLNHFNIELEKESLKTIAAEITRPSDNLFRFMISDLLLNNLKDEQMLRLFTKSTTDYDAEAFIIWSKSALQREVVNSSVILLNDEGNVLGKFELSKMGVLDEILSAISVVKKDPVIFESKNSSQPNTKFLIGIAPIARGNNKIGYIASAVQLEVGFPTLTVIPEFLQSKKTSFNSVIDFSRIKIFEFSDSKLTRVVGDIYPSRDQLMPILNHDFSNSDDAWIFLNINEEKYLTYLTKYQLGNEPNIIAISLLEPKYSINLFNFFKLFIIQFGYILILFIILFLKDLKNFRYTFRFRLTIAFLLISLIPVVFLAVYNRQLVERRTDEAIFNDLSQRAGYVENNIYSKLKFLGKADAKKIFESAANDLGISFSVYDNTNLIYSSEEQLFTAGIFSKRINPNVYYSLNYLSYREFTIKEKIEELTFNSFYKKIFVNDKVYILQTNDLFNKVKLSLSTTDFDVLLFGIYLLAALIIVLISALMANKISAPIRRLTRATMSVAQGDLNVNIENKEKGELKNLLDGFNLMTNELKKNQKELAELERESAWKEMAKQVAHEIKNPLTPMKLSMQQLIASFKDKNKNFAEIFEKVSSTILNQIESLSSIASEFSRFAKMPSFKIEEVDIISSAKDVINLFIDEEISLNLKTEAENLKICADNSQVKRLLINMIRNSIQAGAHNITLIITHESNYCKLIVEDNGRGIPLDIRDRIFEQNFTTKRTGMGIGLKLARRFLDVIGGEIKLIESSPKGTKFLVTFPLSKN